MTMLLDEIDEGAGINRGIKKVGSLEMIEDEPILKQIKSKRQISKPPPRPSKERFEDVFSLVTILKYLARNKPH
jgi:hypothetical protein